MRCLLPISILLFSSAIVFIQCNPTRPAEEIAEEMVHKMLATVKNRDLEGLRTIIVLDKNLRAFDFMDWLPKSILKSRPADDDREFVGFKGFLYPSAHYKPGSDDNVIQLQYEASYWSYNVKKRERFSAELTKMNRDGSDYWMFTKIHFPKYDARIKRS